MGYNIDPEGYDMLSVLKVFTDELGEYGPSPSEIELEYEEIKSRTTHPAAENLPYLLERLRELGFIYYTPE